MNFDKTREILNQYNARELSRKYGLSYAVIRRIKAGDYNLKLADAEKLEEIGWAIIGQWKEVLYDA